VNTDLGDNARSTGTKINGSMISYFGNATYNYDQRYYLSANIRRDGSSKFGTDYRFGIFPSFSGAWRISGESFFSETFISDMKFRGSYGEVGNDRMISDYSGYYAYLAPLRSVRYSMSGSNGSYQVGNVFTTLANPDLKWEFSKQTNVGLDLAMFDNKLMLTADYFITNVEDVLLPISIPGTAGVTATSWTAGEYATMISNAGKLTNKGLEFDVKYNGNIGALNYNLSANLTTFNNEVVDLGDNEFLLGDVSRTYEGGSLGDFYGYVTDGIFQNQEEVDAANAIDGDPSTPYQFDGTAPGDYRYKDLNDDGVINDDDRKVIGSPIPDFTYGWAIDLEYRGFTFYSLFAGVQGNDLYNGMRENLLYSGPQIRNASKEVLNAWNGPGTSNTIPRRTAANANNIGDAQTAYVEDGSYLRLRTFQFGYNLPDALCNTMLMKAARVYISGDNLITFTGYKGFDPEVNNSDNKNAGFDDSFYPHAKVIRLGFYVTF
jgi:TonB-linked SusC/RagA family outer membrane protein